MNAKPIFDFWCDLPKHKNWWHHKFMTPDMESAIKVVLKRGFTIAYLCGAIENYYKARTTKGSWWCDVCNRKWDIETFFTQGATKGQLEWKRFEPERFEMDDCFTPEHKRNMIKVSRQRDKDRDQYSGWMQDLPESEYANYTKVHGSHLDWLYAEFNESESER